MNKELDKYAEEVRNKANRNIDFVIDEAIEKMQSQKRRKRVVGSLSTVFATLALYIIVLNTSVNVQAYVMQNDVLKVISKPLIFNNIFEEVQTQHFEDDLISLDFVLNNFDEVDITRTEVLKKDAYKGLFDVLYVDGSENYKYYYELNTSNEDVMDYPIKALWMQTGNEVQKVYTYHDELNVTTPILSYKGILYVEDRDDDSEITSNYYEIPRHIYAITDSKRERVVEGKPNAMFKRFFISNDTPYMMYMLNESNSSKWEMVNLLTQVVTPLNISLNSNDTVIDMSVLDGSFMMSRIQSTTSSECGDYAKVGLTVLVHDGTTKEATGCSARSYRLVSNTMIYGQQMGDAASVGGQYHIIDLITGEEYVGDDTTEVYNTLSHTNAMIAVMKISAVNESVGVSIQTDLSNNYTYQIVGQAPKEILFTGDYEKLQIIVRDTTLKTNYIYTITKK